MRKKMLQITLCAAMSVCALTCTAMAASTDDYTTANDGCDVTYSADKYTAAYNKAVNGNQYVLLVVKGTPTDYSISPDTIMYIDQKAADATGVSFDFVPKSTPDCVVLLGGNFGAEGTSPVVLGTLKSQGIEVSGTVEYYQVSPWSVNITVKDSLGTVVNTFATKTDGTFDTTLPEGNYKFEVYVNGYLKHTQAVTVAADMGNVSIAYKQYAGNTYYGESCTKIAGVELTYLLADYGKTSMEYYTDLDNDGKCNGIDLTYLLANYNREAD